MDIRYFETARQRKKIKAQTKALQDKENKSKNSYKEYLAKLTDLNWDGND